MEDRIKKELAKVEQGEFHRSLLETCKGLVGMSRTYMKDFYQTWDHNVATYKGERVVDRADADAQNRDEPQKMVVPVTHAQVEALVSFCMALYMQRNSIFELIATGEEDERAAAIGQALLDRDLSWNKFEVVLRQFLLDICRFGIGVIKVGWKRKQRMQTIEVEVPAPTFLGATLGKPSVQERKEEVVEYLGNQLFNVSPYRFFPDVRMPLHRLQEGEFCASEEWYNLPGLRTLEREGVIAGLEQVKPLSSQQAEERWQSSRPNTTLWSDSSSADMMTAMGGKPSKMYVLTECQVSLVPKDYLIDGEPLGPEDYPVKYVVWYVNDQRVVRCEPLALDHDQFTYAVGQYAADQHELIGLSLCDTIDLLQSVLSWFINSHVTSVSKVINDRVIVDPSIVKYEDLEQRRPVIRVRQDAGGQDITKAVMQLSVTDVTARHMEDADRLNQWIMLTTGIQHNALGQYFTGRRTAAEANSTNSATAARMKAFALVNFRCALEVMARQMLSNLRQGLDVEQVVRVAGELLDIQGAAQFMSVSRKDLVGNYDFEIYDGTIPSERANQAMALQEFLATLTTQPQFVIALGYDPKKLVEEWLTLRGIRHPKRFLMDQVRQQELLLQMMATGAVEQLQTPGAQDATNQTTSAAGGPITGAAPTSGGQGFPMGAGGTGAGGR